MSINRSGNYKYNYLFMASLKLVFVQLKKIFSNLSKTSNYIFIKIKSFWRLFLKLFKYLIKLVIFIIHNLKVTHRCTVIANTKKIHPF